MNDLGAHASGRVTMADTEPTHAKSTRYHSLDVWRGLACLMIVVGHATRTVTDEEWIACGAIGRVLWKIDANLYIGVPLFFVISGYCIAATAESTARARAGMASYFRRRFRRIFPPYWVVAALSLGVVLMALGLGFGRLFVQGDDSFPLPSAMAPLQWLGSFTLTETWRFHLVGVASPRLLFFGPSWTLCYEEQFYAVCGFLMALGPQRFWKGLLVISVVTPIVAIASAMRGVPLDGFFFDGRWLIFAAGLLAYYCLNRASPTARRVLLASLALGLIVALAVRYGVMPQRADKEQKLLVFEIVVGGAFALLLVFLRPWDRRLRDAKLLRPIVSCGEMCFSLYLVHWPVTVLVSHGFDELGVKGMWPVLAITTPVALAASIALARVFYVLVEKRFQNQPMKESSASPRPGARDVAVLGGADDGTLS